ncbi:iron complex outermembrane receptor protein [Pseudomonas duriflava]|uniref:Iron complex outermembrane receptor protein n=1 Tax=Pseudomonas duriflava TaxID=459528 RepID=A0A562QL20_9PSED|nr:TonB-dependent siderophore receptor [Pseudomonas duriflava]TWI57457.1 iron complex outermembrane receptor protein [Pseudomonas duriflava]
MESRVLKELLDGRKFIKLNLSVIAIASTLQLDPLLAATTSEDTNPDQKAELNLGPTTIVGESSPAGTTYQPPPISNILRSGTPVQESPQSVTIVPAQVIKDQAPAFIDDALHNVSGITQGNTLGRVLDAVMKRGFGDNRDGSIMRDGAPVVQGRSLTATTESVEALKGPASLLYGIQDPGGVVNVVTKKPQLTAYNAVTARVSTYGNGKNGSGGQFDSTGPIGDFGLAYRLIVDYSDEDYWRSFGNDRSELIAPSLAWYGDNTQVRLSFEQREYDSPFDRGTVIDPTTNRPLHISATRRLDEPFNVREGRSTLTQFEVDHQFNENWNGHFGYSWNRETYDDNQARVTGIDTTTQTVTRRIDGTHGAVSTDSFATASLTGSTELLDMQHDMLVGVDSEKRKYFRADLVRGDDSVLSYTNPVYGTVGTSDNVVASQSDQTDKLRQDALFLQDSIHLDDHWIVVLGGRYQIYDQYAGRGRPFTANTDINGQKWVPRAGLVYKLNDQLSFYTSYAESLKPNSTVAPLSTGQIIDSTIKPEESKSWEIGAKLDIPGRLTGTLAVYDIHKKNVLVSQADDAGVITMRNAGKVRSRGVELDVSGQLTERWSLIGAYAYTDAEVTEDPDYAGNNLANVARNTASLSAVYDMGEIWGGDKLRIGAGARYVGEREGDSENSFKLPSYTVADAFASYDTRMLNHKVKFQLNVKNLFDRTYYTAAASNYYVYLGDSRQVILSTTLEF